MDKYKRHTETPMKHSTALITGATSGVGYAAARILAEEGWREIIITGRSLSQAKETAAKLAAETKVKMQVFTPMELELDKSSSVQSVLDELVESATVGESIDFLLLNAGINGGKERVITAAGIEMSQAPLIGHHQLTVGLLRENLLSPNARIVIAGSEAARGDVPMFSYTDVANLAATQFHGDRSVAVEALLRNGPNVKYEPNRAFADAKLIVIWWVAALARRLPSGMAVYAVSPGSTPSTNAVRNLSPVMKLLMIPLKLIPGMSHTPETAAHRYLQASTFGTDVSGQFFASAPKKLTGPIEAMRHPHFHDHANQEAAWKAVVKVSGVDLMSKK